MKKDEIAGQESMLKRRRVGMWGWWGWLWLGRKNVLHLKKKVARGRESEARISPELVRKIDS